ncbi:hypothetical protein MRB53_037411 [Persea americana]|nr:hypothetical protein MRB53_037411 [Persea americana]
MAVHLAAFATGKGMSFELRSRPTPKPAGNELLISVKSVALNPADHIMRDLGLFLPPHPTVIGFDLAGVVLEVGDDVPTAGQDGSSFHIGSRVAAYAAFYWKSCHADYGAFQEMCLVPWQHAVLLPEDMPWNEAATLPVAVQVPLSAWDAMCIPRVAARESQLEKKEVLLVWGASSSTGSMGVQSARTMRDDPASPFAAVYATAGASNLDYVRSLGADRVFDYKHPQVVQEIVHAANAEGLVIRHCFLAMGELAKCQAVLSPFVVPHAPELKAQVSKIVSAPPLPADAESVEGIQALFVQPSMIESLRLAQFQYWLGTWLRRGLIRGSVNPSPKVTIVGRGLQAINAGLDRLRDGVSCTKLVVEIAD